MLKKIIAAVTLVLLTSFSAHSALILDAAFESGQNGLVSDGGWYSTNAQSGYFGGTNNPEGGSVAHATFDNQDVYSSDISNGAFTIQAGTYTISFAAGNWNNEAFLDFDITFGGMNQSIATSVVNSDPARGTWELWSFTWDVASDSQYIGNAFSFYANSFYPQRTNSNGALDGVGYLSTKGNGFLVEFSASEVPEPSVLSMFALAFFMMGGRRLFKK